MRVLGRFRAETMTHRSKNVVAVTGSKPPYVYDLPHLLSLPAGFPFRFRYQKKWIGSELLADLKRCKDAQAVLVFHSQETGRLIPLRKAEISNVDDFGSFVLFRFRVGDFLSINYPFEELDETNRNEWRREISDALTKKVWTALGVSPEIDLTKPLPPSSYVRFEHDESVSTGSLLRSANWATASAGAWSSVAGLISDEPRLAGVPLFFVHGFIDKFGLQVPIVKIRSFLAPQVKEVEGYKLTSGRRYRLQLAQWYPSHLHRDAPRQAAKVHCSAPDPSLALIGASDVVVGPYDLIEFTFGASESRGPGELAITVSPVGAKESTGVSAIGGSAPRQPRSVGNANNGEAANGAPVTNLADWPQLFAARIPYVVERDYWVTAAQVGACLFGLALVAVAGSKSLNDLGWVGELLRAVGVFVASVFGGALFWKWSKAREAIDKIRGDR